MIKAAPLRLPPLSAAALRKHAARELLFVGAAMLALSLGVAGVARLHDWRALAAISCALGLLSVQLVLVLHDCMHGSLFKKGPLHALLGRLIGAYFLCPYSLLRALHLDHHRNAGLIDGDPEVLDFTRAHAERSPARGLLARIARTPLAALFFAPALQLVHLFEWLAGLLRGVGKTGLLAEVFIDLFCMIALWLPLGFWAASHGALVRVLLFALIIPFAIGLSLTTLATLPLHTLTAGWRLDSLPARERAFHVARTIDSNPLVRALVFNLNFHLEHHLHPGVSRWELGALARELRPVLLREAERTSLPLLLHPGYLRWYLEHMSREEVFNPALDMRTFAQTNRRFTGPLLRGDAPQRETRAPIASERPPMQALPYAR